MARVYHFVNRDFGLEDLKRRRLKIATFEDLNDPFELLGPSSKDQNIRKAFLNVKAALGAFRGMLCFSKNWRNPVQWSHYADGHRGLCFGFDIPDIALTPVIYNSKRFEPDLIALSRKDKASQSEMLKILSTKYSHWRYEQEMRSFVKLEDRDIETGLYFADFSRRLNLREVIVGHRSTVSRKELSDALGKSASKITTRKARLAFRSFTVVEQKKASLWP